MKKKTSLIFLVIVAIITTILFFWVKNVYAEGEINSTINQIVIKDLSSLNIDIDKSKATYTGKPLTKNVNIYDENTKLVQGIDYDVDYKNNIKTGKAEITITGKGNYKGTITDYFHIVPKKAYIRKVLF